MNLLALTLGANASAVLVRQGRVIGASSQERFDGVKNSAAFPKDAIHWLLNEAGLCQSDLDAYVLCEEPKERLANIAPEKKVLFERHLCLALAPVAFFPPVQEPWLIVTADAHTQGVSGAVSVWDGKKLTRLGENPGSSALGAFYGAGTAFLGMTPGEHDYKVMGLAAYAKPEEVDRQCTALFKDIFFFDSSAPFTVQSAFPMTDMPTFLKERALGIRFDVLAGALQKRLETTVTTWISAAMERTGIRRVMTSGSVFMNVKLNKAIREKTQALETRLMPSCGDEVLPFGAAFAFGLAKGTLIKPIKTLYLGPFYDEAFLENFLRTHPLRDSFSFMKCAPIEETLAKLLAQGEPVARFSGKAEYGARSLGNRAILAHPGRLESFFMVNDGIKRRDFWMPFAPTILDTDAKRFIVNDENVAAPHMIDAFATTPQGRHALCAAMHQADGTVRPQILTHDENPEFYELIKAFKTLTGIGAVLNTSLNLHGKPLAATPEQAMETFLSSTLRFLAFGPWLVEKTLPHEEMGRLNAFRNQDMSL